jgi:adenylate cyclase
MGVDEVGTLNALKAIRRELADPAIAAHHGRIVKTTGDGILVEFPSVVDAVSCAVAIQDGMVARNAGVPEDKCIVFRIGINIGDIIIDEADIHGDGVNVAARLEGLADPGGICVSGAAHDQVLGKLDVVFEDMGDRSLKNIARPIRVHRVRWDGAMERQLPAIERTGERRVAVIMFADLAGFSPMMEHNEDEAIAWLSALRREVIEPQVLKHAGRILRMIGDGFVADFSSASEAVKCAIAIQTLAARHRGSEDQEAPEFRIGINLGEIILDGRGDAFGVGVNVARFLETRCEPGKLLISGKVFDEIAGRLGHLFESRGEHAVKNLTQPVRTYAWGGHADPNASGGISSMAAPTVGSVPPLPDKPSIAVLPFQNMSGDPEQEYFADGMVEEIITSLSRVRSFFVIARNSSFTYKGRGVNVKQVGRELGVRYVLEGSVRRGGKRLRVTCQLIEAATNRHVWADRFDGDLEDIFELQDSVAQKVVAAIEPSLRLAEVERALRSRPEDLTAYDSYLRALPHAYSVSVEGIGKALEMLDRAIAVDPNYGQAHGLAGWCYLWLRANNLRRPENTVALGMSHIERALSLDPNDPMILWVGGMSAVVLARQHDRGLELTERSVALNPNSALGWASRGWVQQFSRAPVGPTIESFETAMRLSPLDPLSWYFHGGIGQAHSRAGRYEQAIEWQERALRQNPHFAALRRGLVVCNVRLNRWDEASAQAQKILEADPEFTISKWMENVFLREGPGNEQYARDLRLAGLPE